MKLIESDFYCYPPLNISFDDQLWVTHIENGDLVVHHLKRAEVMFRTPHKRNRSRDGRCVREVFSPTEARLLVIQSLNDVTVYNTETWVQEAHASYNEPNEVSNVRFSHDGSVIVIILENTSIMLLDAHDLKIIHHFENVFSLPDRSDYVTGCVLTPSWKLLICYCYQCLHICDLSPFMLDETPPKKKMKSLTDLIQDEGDDERMNA